MRGSIRSGTVMASGEDRCAGRGRLIWWEKGSEWIARERMSLSRDGDSGGAPEVLNLWAIMAPTLCIPDL